MAKIEEVAGETGQPPTPEPAAAAAAALTAATSAGEGDGTLFDVLSRPTDDNPVATFAKAMREVPLLMTPETMPKDISENPGLMAIQSLLYDGTPEEIAENFKNQGNECFREGRVRFDDALEFYRKGLEQPCSARLRSTMLCIRAAIHIENQNYRMAMDDSKEAVKLDPQNIKAYFRYTKGARTLGKLDEAMEWCKKGLRVDVKNMALLAEHDKLEHEIKERDAAEAKRRAELEDRLQLQRKLDDAIRARGVRLAETQAADGPSPADSYRVRLDEDGLLHWPVLLSYPQYRLTDLIADFCEEHRFIDHLEAVFEERPEWDAAGAYTPTGVALYFETTNAAGKLALAKVKPELTLKKVLAHQSYTVRDRLPGFFVVPKDSPFEKEFMDSYKKL